MAKQRKLWKVLPIVRAIAVLSAVGLITTTVTFAAIQSNGNALTGNTIQTATAALQVSKDGITFSDNVSGYSFTSLVPGGPAQPTTGGGYSVYVKNTGTATQRLLLNVHTPPTVAGTVDLAKVSVVLTPSSTNTPQSFALADLIAGSVGVTNSSVNVGNVLLYHVQVSMASDAVTGNGATISNLDLSFIGTPQ